MATSSRAETVKLLEDVLRILKEEGVFNDPHKKPVVEFIHPKELQEVFPKSLDKHGASKEEIDKIVRMISRYAVKTYSPHFHNQLYAGIDDYGMAGSLLTDILSTSQYTYEVAPVFTLLERELIEKSLELVGYPKLPKADGILCPGGSISNMYSMVLARYKVCPDIKVRGNSGLPPLVCFASEAAHYSIVKGAHWLGIGTDNVYKIKTDSHGRMDVQDLKKAITESKNKGLLPFLVVATCGTTVIGSFDPLVEISKVCKEENLWLHVDACLGGSLLLSPKYRDRLKGIELTDSIAWNPHKMLGAPFQCSLFLTKGENLLHKANSTGAKYLFQQDKFYDVSWDTGDKSIQCGRKVDGMKFWLMWKARGDIGLCRSVENAMAAAEHFYDLIKDKKDYRLVLPRFEGNTICFWYIPPSFQNKKETSEWWDSLYLATKLMKERLVIDGTVMIGYTPLTFKKLGNFFRMVVSCVPSPTNVDMDYVVKEIERVGADIPYNH